MQIQDPRELKRQRNREYYAKNKDEIAKRRSISRCSPVMQPFRGSRTVEVISIDMEAYTILVKFALLLVLVAAALVPSASAEEYCRDSLDGLLACHGFMFEGTPAASPGCCDAYGAVFDTAPFCLCYIANGVYGRSTGNDVNVTRALEIPTSCGQVQPPIQLCGMKDLPLPLYEPESPEASSPSPASAWSAEPPRSSPARDDAISPPPPPTTSRGAHDSSVQMAVIFFTVAAGMVAAAGATP